MEYLDINTRMASTEGKVFAALERIGEAIRAQQWEMAKAYGISPLQLNIILFVYTHQPDLRRPAQMATEFMVSKPTITDAIRTLAKKGLINKEKDPKDTRSSYIHLTAEGEKMAKALSSYPDALMANIGEIGSEGVRDLHHLLLELIAQFQAKKIISPTRMCFTCKHYQGDRKQSHFCQLLAQKLEVKDLRIDCPEHSLLS